MVRPELRPLPRAHCLISGTGFSALAIAAAVAFALDRDWRGPLWIATLAVLAAGVVFETAWTARHGNALHKREPIKQT